jgi:hypothetical protein
MLRAVEPVAQSNRFGGAGLDFAKSQNSLAGMHVTAALFLF